MELDLATRLDWIAVDHHNTGHPHTHVILRGVLGDGRILYIAGDYIAHGSTAAARIEPARASSFPAAPRS
jgi:type IV secretory pathway VirD2 relaxase